jgi:presqualene diphosphate synthase
MSLSAVATQEPSVAARASGSSFYAAMRVLPRAQRMAMFEIYSFCRAVDDIADDGGPVAPRGAALARWRADIDAAFAGAAPAQLQGLAQAIRAFDLQRDDFIAVIDGMEMDVVTDIQAPDWQTLDLYCDRVASAVGRLSVRVFGVPAQRGPDLAHHLGRALQLTNILRDLDEDAAIDRLYLPREALTAAGIAIKTPRSMLENPALANACAPVIARAEAHFVEARRIMAACPRASVRAPRLMGEAYYGILQGIRTRGFAPPRTRIRVSRVKLVLALLRYGLF